MLGRAFARAVRQEINASQQAASRAGGGQSGASRAEANMKVNKTLTEEFFGHRL